MPELSHHPARLAEITDSILDHDSDTEDLRQATETLHGLCSAITGLSEDPDNGEADHETRLDAGRALSPRDAARCILDIARTTAFMRGVHDAVRTLQSRFPGEKINLLYAGCGPFAPLVLPLTQRFSPDELGLTLLDAHDYSIESVRSLGRGFGISNWFSRLCRGDAMDYVHPEEEPLHLVVIETMQKALEHEPQVALTQRLVPQLAPGGILIPERIRLTACLADMGAEFSFIDPDRPSEELDAPPRRRRVELGSLLELTVDGLGNLPGDNTEGPQTTTILIPDEANEAPDLMVRTTVEVFGDHRLDDYDSGISYPTLIHRLGGIRPGDRIEFSYETGSSPGLRIRRAATP